jgi:hypothetical protein
LIGRMNNLTAVGKIQLCLLGCHRLHKQVTPR